MTLRRAARGAAIAVLATASMVSCGNGTHGSAPAAPGPRIAEGESDVLALDEQISGTAQDRGSLEYLTYHAVQSYYETCMARAGMRYNVAVFRDPSAGREHASLPGLVDELPETSPAHVQQHALGVADELVGWFGAPPAGAASAAARSAAYRRSSPAAKTRYNDQLSECQSAQPPGIEVADEPEGMRQLQEDFSEMVYGIADGADVQELSSGYPACMKEAGFPVPDRVSLLNTFANEYSAVLPDVHLGEVLDPGEASFRAVRARELRAAEADARCRSAAHDLVIEKLAPQVEAFEQEFAPEIAALRAEWDSLTLEAERLREQSRW